MVCHARIVLKYHADVCCGLVACLSPHRKHEHVHGCAAVGPLAAVIAHGDFVHVVVNHVPAAASGLLSSMYVPKWLVA